MREKELRSLGQLVGGLVGVSCIAVGYLVADVPGALAGLLIGIVAASFAGAVIGVLGTPEKPE